MHHAFESFVREHQDMVYSTAMRITGDAAESEDIAQQAFVQAYERFGELQAHENPGGWLRLTARNLSINHVKRHIRRWRFFGSSEELPEAEGSEQQEPDSWMPEEMELLKRCLSALPGKFRAPLVLFHYEDMAYEDIAQSLGCSVGKVKTDIHRARGRLRREIETMGSDHEAN